MKKLKNVIRSKKKEPFVKPSNSNPLKTGTQTKYVFITNEEAWLSAGLFIVSNGDQLQRDETGHC